jgi:hypothetical protein
MAQARVSLKRGRLKAARESLTKAKFFYQEMGVEDGTGELRSIEEAFGELGVKGG